MQNREMIGLDNVLIDNFPQIQYGSGLKCFFLSVDLMQNRLVVMRKYWIFPKLRSHVRTLGLWMKLGRPEFLNHGLYCSRFYSSFLGQLESPLLCEREVKLQA